MGWGRVRVRASSRRLDSNRDSPYKREWVRKNDSVGPPPGDADPRARGGARREFHRHGEHVRARRLKLSLNRCARCRQTVVHVGIPTCTVPKTIAMIKRRGSYRSIWLFLTHSGCRDRALLVLGSNTISAVSESLRSSPTAVSVVSLCAFQPLQAFL